MQGTVSVSSRVFCEEVVKFREKGTPMHDERPVEFENERIRTMRRTLPDCHWEPRTGLFRIAVFGVSYRLLPRLGHTIGRPSSTRDSQYQPPLLPSPLQLQPSPCPSIGRQHCPPGIGLDPSQARSCLEVIRPCSASHASSSCRPRELLFLPYSFSFDD